MSYAMARGNFYADGLRWIASLLTAAAERLERRNADPLPIHPASREAARDEALYELRHRLTNTW